MGNATKTTFYGYTRQTEDILPAEGGNVCTNVVENSNKKGMRDTTGATSTCCSYLRYLFISVFFCLFVFPFFIFSSPGKIFRLLES